MNYKSASEGNDNYTKWKTAVTKYENLLKTEVKEKEPLGKYQPIFNILKSRIFKQEDQFSF